MTWFEQSDPTFKKTTKQMRMFRVIIAGKISKMWCVSVIGACVADTSM